MSEAHTDCRSEEGITVGLIDAIINNARLLKGRPVTDAVREALADLQADDDVIAILAADNARLREAGNPLSNAAYNLAQKQGHTLTQYDCELLSELRRRWDAALAGSGEGE